MEKDRKILTCLMKDDFSSLVLLYRKFASLDNILVGLQTAYDRRNQKFIITQNLTKCFPNIACLGPIPVYEEYVTMANYPFDTNMEDYVGNVINVDILDHLKTHHLDEIYPKQRTVYHPQLFVEAEEFNAVKTGLSCDKLNVVINMFDAMLDKDFSMIYDFTLCLDSLQKEFGIPMKVHLAGLVHDGFRDPLFKSIKEEIDTNDDVELVNIAGQNFTEQVAYLMHCDLFLSGSYGLGFLAYMIRAPSFIIFPYHMVELKGKTTDPKRNTDLWYAETTDDDVLSDLDKGIKIARRAYDRNRNSNI